MYTNVLHCSLLGSTSAVEEGCALLVELPVSRIRPELEAPFTPSAPACSYVFEDTVSYQIARLGIEIFSG